MKKKVITISIVLICIILILAYMISGIGKDVTSLIDDDAVVEITVSISIDDVSETYQLNLSQKEKLKVLLEDVTLWRTFQNVIYTQSGRNGYNIKISSPDKDMEIISVEWNKYVQYDNVFYKIITSDFEEGLKDILEIK